MHEEIEHAWSKTAIHHAPSPGAILLEKIVAGGIETGIVSAVCGR